MKNFMKITEKSFCEQHCRGKYFDKDNSKRQANVRAAMKDTAFTELPHLCAGSISCGCLCEYAK